MRIYLAAVLVCLFLLGTGMAMAVAHHWSTSQYRLLQATFRYHHPEWTANWSCPREELARLEQALAQAVGSPVAPWPEHYVQYQVELSYPDAERILYIAPDGLTYCPRQQVSYRSLGEVWGAHLSALDASFFGAPVHWSLVGQLWPRKSKAWVTDLDSGRGFWLYRWGGNLHADVEPLTAQDAAIMKEVFDGEYTWRRRAVIVELQGQRIAGSLHAMPHGGGDIRDNSFPGHACLHFTGSTTHGTRREDPAHGIMLHKAAGQWWKTLAEPEPASWAHHYLVLLAQRDLSALSRFTAPTEARRMQALSRQLASLQLGEPQVGSATTKRAQVTAEVTAYYAGDWDPHHYTLELDLERHPVSGVWQLVRLSGW